MAETIRLTGRPILGERQGPQRGSAARQGDYLAALPRNTELSGLLDGLQALNPAIQQMRQAEVDAAARAAEAEAQAAAARVDNPVAALQEPLPDNPLNAPPALAGDSRRIFQAGVSRRAALKIRADALQEYNSVKDAPDFNFGDWIAKTRGRALEGLTDPTAVDTIGRTMDEFEGLVRQDAERARVDRIQAAFKESAQVMAADLFTADKGPQGLYQVFQERYVPALKAMGLSRMEAAQYMLQQLEVQSTRAGGIPELFEVFEQPDADGRTMAAHSPALASTAAKLKQQALDQREQARRAAAVPINADWLMSFRERELKDPMSITREEIAGRIGPGSAFPTAESAASAWESVLRSQQAYLKAKASETYTGPLLALDAAAQQKVMDARLGPLFQTAMQALQAGDTQNATRQLAAILEMQSVMQTSVPWDTMRNWTTSLVTNLPAKDGPPAGFKAAAELWKAMSAYPALRDRYFPQEDTRTVLESYTAATSNQGDPVAAYAQAYEAISPGAKAAAKALTESPEFRAMRDKESQKWVAGSSMNFMRVFGFAGRPENGSYIGGELQAEMFRWRSANPSAPESQAEAYAEQWVKNNFVMDRTTRVAVRIPPGFSGEATSEAVSNFTSNLAKQLKLGSRNDADWKIMLAPAGTQGDLRVLALGNGTQQYIQTVNIAQLVSAEAAKKAFTADELPRVGPMLQAIREGRFADVDPALLAKAQALRQVTPEQAEGFFKSQSEAFKQRLQNAPRVPLKDARDAPLSTLPDRGAKVDLPGTMRSALNMLTTPMVSQSTALASSLVAMGEGLVLQAYDDPAKDAGKNIGFGYNLKANAKTARADLKAAGVPEDRIDGVIAGTAALLPDQAERLLRVSLGRYERQAREVIDAAVPGLWSRMTPTQHAVMVDIAYQTGNPGQFKKAIAALAAGKDEEFQQEAATFYTNRKGVRVEDRRRNGLRAAMLAGNAEWEATVLQQAKVPASKLQALAQATQ